MDRADPRRRRAHAWWYTGATGAAATFALMLVLTGRPWWAAVSASVWAFFSLPFRYVMRMGPSRRQPSRVGRLAALDDRVIARFNRPPKRPVSRLQRRLQELDDTYAPGAYRTAPRD